jgi:hypothetical protein
MKAYILPMTCRNREEIAATIMEKLQIAMTEMEALTALLED